MFSLSRRNFLRLTAASAALGAVGAPLLSARGAEREPVELFVDSRVIEVDGKAASVFGLARPDGVRGFSFVVSADAQRFLVNRPIDAETRDPASLPVCARQRSRPAKLSRPPLVASTWSRRLSAQSSSKGFSLASEGERNENP